MDNIRLDDFISNLENERPVIGLSKEASLNEDVNINKEDYLSDLQIENVSFTKKTSENLEKIASVLDRTPTIEELIKVAEEAGNSDIANLVKIADSLGDRIAERIIDRIKESMS